MKQTYRNHIRYYPPHHYIFLPLMGILMITGIVMAINHPPERLIWALFALLSFCILFLAIMLRQHYALGNQDRIVRLEFRLRYLEQFGGSAKETEGKLSFGQIAALRFAGDAEFKALLEAAINEQLTGKDIKRRVQDWQADYMRV